MLYIVCYTSKNDTKALYTDTLSWRSFRTGKHDNKKQHYIPQTYLAPFSFPNRGKEKTIWVYDKIKQEGVKQKGIKKICQKNNFYSHKNDNNEEDDTVEKILSVIEGKFTKIRDKIIGNCKNYNENKKLEEITSEERVHFLEFIYTLFLRIPSNLDSAKQEACTGYKKYFSIPNETDEHLNNEVKKNICLSMVKQEALDRATKKLDIAKWNISIIPDQYPERFITNDNPVLITSEIKFLSITPTIRISLLLNQKEPYLYEHCTSTNDIQGFNFAMFERAQQFVLSYDQEVLNSFFSMYLYRGNTYALNGDYDSAINDVSMAIGIKPNYSEAYFHRGNTYALKGNYDSAIDDFSMAIEIKPDYLDAYFHRGCTYGNAKKLNKAIEDFTKIMELNPDYESS